MWHREYKDYPTDTPLVKNRVEPSHGIVGCEMHELNGWGNTLHHFPRRKKRGLVASLLYHWFGSSDKRPLS